MTGVTEEVPVRHQLFMLTMGKKAEQKMKIQSLGPGSFTLHWPISAVFSKETSTLLGCLVLYGNKENTVINTFLNPVLNISAL